MAYASLPVWLECTSGVSSARIATPQVLHPAIEPAGTGKIALGSLGEWGGWQRGGIFGRGKGKQAREALGSVASSTLG